jgi:hypothetical protein
MKSVLLAIGAVAWLVAAWAMVMMIVAGRKDREQLSLGWFFGGSFVLANYNRKYLRIFAACIFSLVALVIAFNVLLFTGHIKP